MQINAKEELRWFAVDRRIKKKTFITYLKELIEKLKFPKKGT